MGKKKLIENINNIIQKKTKQIIGVKKKNESVLCKLIVIFFVYLQQINCLIRC